MINLIYSQSRNGFIGKDNDLLFYIPADMARFRTKTLNKVVIMGHNTWKSLPEKVRPLPRRINVVLSRDTTLEIPGVVVFHSLKEALIAYADQEVWLIGGESIFKEGMRYAKTIYQTYIDKDVEGDARAPVIDFTQWRLVSMEPHVYEDLTYQYRYYQRS